MTTFFQFLITGIMLGRVYGLVALGLVIIYKSSRVLNLAHGGFLNDTVIFRSGPLPSRWGYPCG